MKIGILQCGNVPPILRDEYHSYGEILSTLIASGAHDISVFDIENTAPQNLPALLDEMANMQGFIISGSRHGVYDDLPWMRPLQDFITGNINDKKFIGICFGHQIIAAAMGGEVTKFPNGWGLGLRDYQPHDNFHQWLTQNGLARAPQNIYLYSFHGDQIITKPHEAILLAQSNFCCYAILAYPNDRGDIMALTFQAHPEFSKAYSRALLELYSDGEAWTVAEGENALKNLDNAPATRDFINHAIRHFMRD